jgi:hypothetical protein
LTVNSPDQSLSILNPSGNSSKPIGPKKLAQPSTQIPAGSCTNGTSPKDWGKINPTRSRPATEDQIMNPPRPSVPSVRQASAQAFAAALDELQATFDADDGLGDALFGDGDMFAADAIDQLNLDELNLDELNLDELNSPKITGT